MDINSPLIEYFKTGGIYGLLSWVIGILVIITVHELAHAASAYYFGDHTAANEGRLTLNPMKHYHPVGTTMLLLLGFGWASTPVNPANMRNPRRDDAIVSLCGPLANLLTAVVCGLILRFPVPPFLVLFLLMLANWSLFFCFFNLLPIGPLDGAHILAGLLPYEQSRAYSRVMNQWGMMIFFGVIFIVPKVITVLVATPVSAMLRLLIPSA